MAEHKIQSTDAADAVKKASASSRDASTRNIPLLGPQSAAPSAKGPGEDEETFDNFDSSPAVPRSKRLVVDLDPVPKFLKNLVDGWAPEGMFLSRLVVPMDFPMDYSVLLDTVNPRVCFSLSDMLQA
jgi:phosphopantothenate-cysteine ligase